MRIHLKTTPSNKTTEFNHQHLLTGTLHKWFGNNDFHDATSLYSFSSLKGAIRNDFGIKFSDGASFFISCWNDDYLKLLIDGIQKSPDMFDGLTVNELIIQENPNLENISEYQLGSPVFIKRKLDSGHNKFFYYNDKESGQYLTETIKTKMELAGLEPDDTLDISFNLDHPKKRVKKIDYKRGKHITGIKASWCPVIINAKPTTKVFAWNVGLGNSTGIGFGSIR